MELAQSDVFHGFSCDLLVNIVELITVSFSFYTSFFHFSMADAIDTEGHPYFSERLSWAWILSGWYKRYRRARNLSHIFTAEVSSKYLWNWYLLSNKMKKKAKVTKAMGVPRQATFLQEHSAYSTCVFQSEKQNYIQFTSRFHKKDQTGRITKGSQSSKISFPPASIKASNPSYANLIKNPHGPWTMICVVVRSSNFGQWTCSNKSRQLHQR